MRLQCAACIVLVEGGRLDPEDSHPAVTFVAGTAMCAAHAVEEMGEVIGRPIPEEEQMVGQCTRCAEVGRVCVPYGEPGPNRKCPVAWGEQP